MSARANVAKEVHFDPHGGVQGVQIHHVRPKLGCVMQETLPWLSVEVACFFINIRIFFHSSKLPLFKEPDTEVTDHQDPDPGVPGSSYQALSLSLLF